MNWKYWRRRVTWAVLAIAVLIACGFAGKHGMRIHLPASWSWHGFQGWLLKVLAWIWEKPLWTWFTRSLLLGVAGLFAWYVGREVFRDVVIFDPFSVPKSFEEAGITPKVLANRVGSAMESVERGIYTSVGRDTVSYAHIEGGAPEVEVPGTRIGLKGVIEMVRHLVGRYPKRVSGDICLLDLEDKIEDASPSNEETVTSSVSIGAKPKAKNVLVTVYVTQGRSHREVNRFEWAAMDIDGFAKEAAEQALEHINRLLFAASLRFKGASRAESITREIAESSTENKLYRCQAFRFWAVLLMDKEEYELAVEKCRAALNQIPQDTAARASLGYLLSRRGRHEEALEEFKIAAKDDPNNPVLLNYYAKTHFERGEFEKACEKHQQSVAVNKNSDLALANWAAALLNLGRSEEAAEKCQQAIAINKNNDLALTNWAAAFLNLSENEEAGEKCRQAVAINKNNDLALANWAAALLNLGQDEEACEKCRQAVVINKNNYRGLANWGRALVNLGRAEEACEKFQQAIAINKNNERTMVNWGTALLHLQRNEEACERFQQAVRINPHYAYAYHSWSVALRRLGKLEDATEKSAKAKELGWDKNAG